MQNVNEFFPQLPFDLHSGEEQLLDVSVELCGDRLKGIVAWLVSCIKQQQSMLQAHAIQLGATERSPGAGEGDAGSKTSSRPNLDEALSQSLQSAISGELLSMQVVKLQHELNCLPTFDDVDKKDSSILAEVSSLSNNITRQMSQAEDKIDRKLGAAADELHDKLRNICDDLMERLESLEKCSAKFGWNSQELNRSRGPPHVGETLEVVASAQEPMHGKNVDEASIDVSAGGVHVDQSLSSQPGGAREQPDPVPPGPASSVRAETTSSEKMPQPGQLAEVRPSELKYHPETQASAQSTFLEESLQQTCNVPAADQDGVRPISALIGSRVIEDGSDQQSQQIGSSLELAKLISDLNARVERNRQQCLTNFTKIDVQITDTRADIMSLSDKQKKDLEGLGMQLDEIRHELVHGSEADSSRPTSRQAMNISAESSNNFGQKLSAEPQDSHSPRPRRKSKTDEGIASISNALVVGRLRPESSQLSRGSKQLEDALAGVHDELGSMQEQLDGAATQMQELLGSIPRLRALEDGVRVLQEIMMPKENLDLGAAVCKLEKRMGDVDSWRSLTDKKIRRISPLDSEFADVQIELERYRKLFEFIQQVLPSDAAEAMTFFNKSFQKQADRRSTARGSIASSLHSPHLLESQVTATSPDAGGQPAPLADRLAGTLGPEVAFEHHRSKLEEEMRQHEKSMREEFDNLSLVIKSLQRQVQHTAGKTGDLVDRVARVEVERAKKSQKYSDDESMAHLEKPSQKEQGQEAHRRSLDEAASPEPPIDDEKMSCPPLEEKGHVQSYVSKDAMQKALKETRDDFRTWLDEWSSDFVSALQQKADNKQVKLLLTQLEQAMGVSGLTTDNFAMLAKRALFGRCASCDADINVDFASVKKVPPVPRPVPYPNHPSAGASLTMRVPAGTAQMPQVLLPRIPGSNKEFPKGRIFKTSSTPDIRQPSREEMQQSSREDVL
jgi:hypothetical protein